MTAVELPPELSMTFGIDGLLRDVSPAFAVAHGDVPAGIRGRSLFELVAPEEVPLVLRAFSALSQGSPIEVWETELGHPDRRIVWDGHAVTPFLFEVSGHDVTHDRRRARRLRDKTRRTQEALAIADAAAWEYDVRRDRLLLDTDAEHLFAADHSVRTWADLAERVHPDDRQAFLAVRAQINVSDGFDGQFRLLDGNTTRYVAMRGRRPAGREDGDRIIGVVWDITVSKSLEEQLYTLAMRDHLTTVWNRRAFELALNKQWQSVVRTQASFGLVLVDADNFKAYNDTHGHPRGDAALVELASVLTTVLHREADVLARYGGEEFVLLLADCEEDGAHVVAMNAVAAAREGSPLTVSAGSAAVRADDSSAWDVLRRADEALYRAKAAGRDQALAAE